MNTTPTPRTDAAVIPNADLSDWGHGDSPYVRADFARQLERELAASNALLREADSAIKNSVDLICWPGFNEKQVKACYAALNRIATHLEASK